MRPLIAVIAITFGALAWIKPGVAVAKGSVLRVAVTTSFENSGLAEVLVPEAEIDLDVDIQLLVVGTGQALKLGRAGDVDAVIVHSKAAEDAFVAAQYGVRRTPIMVNDFVIVGPADDPAGIAQAKSAKEALTRIQATQSLFVSRGDDSGTHKKERALWASRPEQRTGAAWYREIGAGMGAALNTASAMGAYTLSDRASWLTFKNKRILTLLFKGDPALLNPYSFIRVNPNRHAHIAAGPALAFENWLTSKRGQALINGYTLDGAQLFRGLAKP